MFLSCFIVNNIVHVSHLAPNPTVCLNTAKVQIVPASFQLKLIIKELMMPWLVTFESEVTGMNIFEGLQLLKSFIFIYLFTKTACLFCPSAPSVCLGYVFITLAFGDWVDVALSNYFTMKFLQMSPLWIHARILTGMSFCRRCQDSILLGFTEQRRLLQFCCHLSLQIIVSKSSGNQAVCGVRSVFCFVF